MEYYVVVKQKELLPFVTTWMDLEIIMLSQIRQLEKDKYRRSHSYVESNEQNKRTNTIKPEVWIHGTD